MLLEELVCFELSSVLVVLRNTILGWGLLTAVAGWSPSQRQQQQAWGQQLPQLLNLRSRTGCGPGA